MSMTTRDIPENVLDMLQQGTCDGSRYTMPQLDRSDYDKVKKVLDAAGLKWDRKSKAHIAADGDADEAIETLLMTGRYLLPADLGQFDTPPELAERIVEMAGVTQAMHVLEPSCGVGNLVGPLLARGAQVAAVELAPDRFRTSLQAVSHLKFFLGDFLEIGKAGAPMFDRVVMNPPFAKRADVAHVMCALGWLKPTGRLVAIMSAGVSFRHDKATVALREVVRARGGSIDPLPADSFHCAGTSVNTVVVSIPGG